jgi:alkanesulfonate monooxygenase SsuD/methylene tetrahydromethanopterin reductase-like flavin-dependent oxidoreductase (luciferase family)
MKKPADTKKLEKLLRSSKLVLGGFLGNDSRQSWHIIDADMAELSRRSLTPGQLAQRMRQITRQATEHLGSPVQIAADLQAQVEETRGFLVCPWAHPGRFAKRVTTLTNTRTGRTISWSDLNIHLIEQHGFFEGKGSPFRIEPAELVELIF